MIKSMTGFGQAIGGGTPFRWAVEIRSWNHRFFECSTRLPNVVAGLDEKIRDLVHTHVKRGKITVAVFLRSKQSANSNGLVLDEKKISSYIRLVRRIQKKYRLGETVSVNALLSIPNLFTVDQKEYAANHYWTSLRGILEKAIGKLLRAKVREGETLAHDLRKRARLMTHSLDRIELAAKTLPEERKNRLKARLTELAESVSLDSGRLEQEAAIWVDRSDVTEELVRARHHLRSLEQSISQGEEAGKKLDFIAQELHREANTIASKAQSSEIAEEVISLKSELEKIREQVQNIE